MPSFAFARRIRELLSRSPLRVYFGSVLVAVLPLTAFFYSANRIVQRQTLQQAKQNNMQVAALSSLFIEDHFRQSIEFLQSYATDPKFQQEWAKQDLKAIQTDMDHALELQPDMELISTYSPDGTLSTIAPFDPSVVGRNYAWRDWYKGLAKNWKPYLSEVYRPTAAPRLLSVAISIPIKDANWKPVGIVAAAYSLAQVSSWLQEVHAYGERSILVADQRGRLLAATDIDLSKPALDLSSYQPVILARQGQRGAGFFQRDQQNLFVAYQPIEDFGWSVIAEEPASFVLQQSRDARRHLAVIGLFFIALVFLGGILVSLLSRRQQSLTQRLDALSLSEANYRSMVQGATYGIYRTDEKGLVYANPALVKMLGYASEAELLSIDMARDLYWEPGARERALQMLRDYPDGQSVELLWKLKDGTPITVRVNGRAIRDSEDQVLGFEGIVEDVTSRHLLEEQLRHSEKLAALGRLVAGAAHEINNPLTAILGYAELLAIDPAATPEQRNFAEKIRQAARRTKTVTTNLQSFSSQQKKAEVRQLVDLNSVVSNALRIQQMNLGASQIKLQRELESALPSVNGDEYQILEVCMHILNNSVDALRESGGGTITATTRSQNGTVIMEFSDSGPGIQDLARVFDPFYSTKPLGSGSGLGLSASYGIIKGHGGSIECANRPEGGATVIIRLPAATLEEPSSGYVAASTV